MRRFIKSCIVLAEDTLLPSIKPGSNSPFTSRLYRGIIINKQYMDTYKVETPNEYYTVEAENSNKARKKILEKEGITFSKIELEDVGDTTGDWIFLEQDDPKWKDTPIGDSDTDVGTDGCLITDLSMLSYWFGEYFTPREIAQKAKFTSKGWYIWRNGDSFLPFDFVYRYYRRDITKIKQILFSKDNACIVRVSHGRAYHWLAVIGYDQKTGRLLGADPLDGASSHIEIEYGRINGFAEVTRK